MINKLPYSVQYVIMVSIHMLLSYFLTKEFDFDNLIVACVTWGMLLVGAYFWEKEKSSDGDKITKKK